MERKISTGEKLIGKAVFENISDTAFLLREEGELLLLSGSVINASRQWYWHLCEGDGLEVTYDSKRAEAYHSLKPKLEEGLWQGTADHLCGADCYQGYYWFGENKFGIDQTIKGPAKDYKVQSVYSKNPEGLPECSPREP